MPNEGAAEMCDSAVIVACGVILAELFTSADSECTDSIGDGVASVVEQSSSALHDGCALRMLWSRHSQTQKLTGLHISHPHKSTQPLLLNRQS